MNFARSVEAFRLSCNEAILTFFGVHILTRRFACNSAVDCRAQTIWIIGAHRESQRFVA